MMKKIRSIFCLLLTVLMLLPFAGCTGGEGGGETTETDLPEESTAEEKKLLEIVRDGKTAYSVVRPDGAGERLINSARQVVNSIESATGCDMEFKTDFKYPNAKPDSTRYEILVGLCDRPEVQEAIRGMRSKDFFAGVVGEKIVLVGLNDEMTARAVDNFVMNVVKKKAKTTKDLLVSDEDNITFTFSSYKLNKCTVIGADVTDYGVVYLKGTLYSAERSARVFANCLADKSGYVLPVTASTVTAAPTSRTIFFGSADSSGSEVTQRHGFSVRAEGTCLYVAAECEIGYAAALEYLTEELFVGDDVTVGADFSHTGTAALTDGGDKYIDQRLGTYRVIFHNILGNCDTSLYPTQTRNQMAAELHHEYDPDFICLQECSDNSRGASSYITTMVKWGWLEVPVTVTNSNKINYTPLLYKKDKFTVVESGYHLYSDGANDKSKSITWGVFDDKATGKRVAVLSTHFYWTSDELGKSARIKDAEQITSIAKMISDKYDCPVIAGGDLNCNISSDPIRNMLAAGFRDIYDIATKSEDITSHHAYPEYNKELKYYDTMTFPSGSYSKAIDHAVVWNDAKFTAKLFEIITDDYALLSADHCPVMVDFDLQ